MNPMETCPGAPMRMDTTEKEVAISRKCTEDHPPTVVTLSTTPQRDKESKRRRLTSETGGCLLPRGAGEALHAAEYAQLAALLPDDVIRSQLVAWGKALKEAQPKVFMSEHLIECGLCLYKYLRHLQVNATMDGRLSPAYFANQQLIMHDIIGCWWIGLKCCSIRTAVPNRALMCKATGANPPLLGDCELAALIAMDWEATAVLREHGLIQ